ncbi:adenine deaminase [Bacillus kwashiorkori]|uniref:adenine deaminase n=1 Tax=Bacillus kwashiorkori TaxID=1522318 RepID=UPI000AC61D35|nr:adenine deaminase [Bacillus kwashiorkori]
MGIVTEGSMKRVINVAAKRELADVVIKGGKIVDVFNLEVITGDIAIADGMIVGIGDFQGKHVIDAAGQYIAPGFIDGHVHIESTMATPKEFSKVVLPHGVTTVVADPHEIANVSGTDGIQFMIDESEGLDLDVRIMLPSCVPATTFENAGAVLNNNELKPFYHHSRVLGLAEVMDFPSVKNSEPNMIEKMVCALNYRHHIDGHCSGFDEDGINIYRSAQIKTDHECVSRKEVQMRIQRGMYVMIREGSTTKNLKELLPMVTPYNARRFLFCTDDKHINELRDEGSIDHNIRLAINSGMNPLQAIQIATLNAAECFGLTTKGAIAPGFEADLVFISDLSKLVINRVVKAGRTVAQSGKYVGREQGTVTSKLKSNLIQSVHIADISKADLKIMIGEDQTAHVIGLIKNQVVTKKQLMQVPVNNGEFIPSVERDLVKLAVIERHKSTGNVGLGIVHGLQLLSGAIASTVAHDSHNLVVAGTNDDDMLTAIKTIATMNGGLVVVLGGEVISKLELPISGLLSEKPYEEIIAELDSLHRGLDQITMQKNAHTFITLSFLSLPVIPSLKLTDQGLFDVDEMKHISISHKVLI